jgi:hypothetical protein
VVDGAISQTADNCIALKTLFNRRVGAREITRRQRREEQGTENSAISYCSAELWIRNPSSIVILSNAAMQNLY